MSARKFFFIIDKLSDKRGGLTKALLDRANYLALNNEVYLLVTEFQDKFEIMLEKLINLNKINKKIKVRNFFHELCFDFNNCLEINLDNSKKNNQIFYEYNSDYTREFSDDGTYLRYKKYLNKKNKQLVFIDDMSHYDFDCLRQRSVFYKGHFYALQKYSDKKNNQLILYKSNYPKFIFWYKEYKLHKSFCFSSSDQVATSFDLEEEFNCWLIRIISKNDVLFLDQNFKRYENILDRLECEKIGVVHNHHILNGDAGYLVKSKKYSKYVFLTEIQKNDLVKKNNHLLNKSYVIPHSYSEIENKLYRKNRIVTISRLSLGQKKILEGILAFSKIHTKFPNIIYEIYGVGDAEEKIRTLISDLKLEKKVLLMGYTDKSLEIFSTSLMSINLSSYEGFGLSLIESISMACPVIASYVDYGPKEIVKNGVNGFLVDNNDIDNIAEKIEYILENFQFIREKCHSSIKDFSPENWRNNINKLIN